MIKKKFGKPEMTFSEKVVALALMVPPGRVTTYGDIARVAGGGAMASRSVTGILSKAWDNGEKKIPFHRIVYAGGKVWVNEEYRASRMKLYKKEGIEIDSRDRIVDFEQRLFNFKP
jgi:methylated-DNA-protein-cysteine methyltransferase-like protein